LRQFWLVSFNFAYFDYQLGTESTMNQLPNPDVCHWCEIFP